MDYYGYNDYRNYLSLRHHGILGQKWGKKNGPPYPLDGADHSASEKKAGWRKSLGGGSNDSVSKKRRGSVRSEARAGRKQARNEYKERKKAIDENYKKERERYIKITGNENTTLDELAEAETRFLKAGVNRRNQLNDTKNQLRKDLGKKEKDYSEKNSVTEKMKISKSDSKITQGVKRDYNNLSDKDFFRTYGVSKKTYKKRVDKYGDPYKRARDMARNVESGSKDTNREKAKKAYVSTLTKIAANTEQSRKNTKDERNASQKETKRALTEARRRKASEAQKAKDSKGLAKAYHGVKKLSASSSERRSQASLREKYEQDKATYRRIQDLRERVQNEYGNIKPGNSFSRAQSMANAARYNEEIRELSATISDENLKKLRKAGVR